MEQTVLSRVFITAAAHQSINSAFWRWQTAAVKRHPELFPWRHEELTLADWLCLGDGREGLSRQSIEGLTERGPCVIRRLRQPNYVNSLKREESVAQAKSPRFRRRQPRHAP